MGASRSGRTATDSFRSPGNLHLSSANPGASDVFHFEVSPASALVLNAAVADLWVFLGLDDG